MLSFLGGIIGNFLAGIAEKIALFFAVKRAGEVEQQARDLEAAEAVEEREAKAAAAAPDTPAELDERLDEGTF